MKKALRRYRNKHKKVQLLKQLRQRKHFSKPTGDIESELDNLFEITDLELTTMKEGWTKRRVHKRQERIRAAYKQALKSEEV